MKSRYFFVAAFAAAVLLSPIRNVEACGPFFEDEVFVSNTNPDDLTSFSKGQLGILQPRYDSDVYAIAWRYLTGGRLSAKEQSAINPPAQDLNSLTAEQWKAYEEAEKAAEESTPPKLWEKARAEYASAIPAPGQQIGIETNVAGGFHYTEYYLNCPSPSFLTAILTLRRRAATWGKSNSAILDWIRAQDAVFSNCDGKAPSMPSAAPAGAPALLSADRAYQIAAANLYAGKYDEAAQQFAAIAADQESPWHDMGNYLAARAIVRKAFALGKGSNPYSEGIADFDPGVMNRAQQILEHELSSPHRASLRNDLQAELNFIRIRTEPEKRAAEISADLTGPKPDPIFAQDLKDLSWLLQNQIAIKNPPPLLAWIAAWRGSGTAASAYALWQQNHSLPWLVMATVKAGTSDAFAPDLIAEAAKIAPESPAYDTAFYHRVRLLIALNQTDEARALLEKALAAPNLQKPSSERNAILGERMAVARDFSEFLEFAPRVALETGSEPAVDLRALCQKRAGLPLYGGKTAPCPELDRPITFDSDATNILNEETPLSQLIEAANSPVLPPNLRRNIAIASWARAVILDDTKSAAALAPSLPTEMGVDAKTGSGFPAFVAILRHDGLQPILDSGIARVASYSQFDEYRDNGWCKLAANNGTQGGNKPPSSALPTPPIFTPAEQQQAASEFARLKALPDSSDFFGQRVIDYAEQHPNDPDVPEALALVVRATHYDCQTFDPNVPYDKRPRFSVTGKAAFELLHKRYPKSPWTAKTPYYY